jgi:hypothetical protein
MFLDDKFEPAFLLFLLPATGKAFRPLPAG